MDTRTIRYQGPHAQVRTRATGRLPRPVLDDDGQPTGDVTFEADVPEDDAIALCRGGEFAPVGWTVPALPEPDDDQPAPPAAKPKKTKKPSGKKSGGDDESGTDGAGEEN